MSKQISENAYRKIRDLIVSGELAPGEQLKEQELAAICQVSRTPVREAIRRLQAEMFVVRSENQRSFVPDWSVDDARELFDLRVRIEGYAAACAAERASPDQIAQMKAVNDELDAQLSASRTIGIDAFILNNRDFHQCVADAAGSDRIRLTLWRVIYPPIVRQTVKYYDREAMLRSLAEHRELTAAFEAHDSAWAEALMAVHVRRAHQSFNLSKARTDAG